MRGCLIIVIILFRMITMIRQASAEDAKGLTAAAQLAEQGPAVLGRLAVM